MGILADTLIMLSLETLFSIFTCAPFKKMGRILLYAGLIHGLSACFGGSSSVSTTVNIPDLPAPPISRLVLGDDYVGFIIGSQPISNDPQLSSSQQYSQFLYELSADNSITPVTLLDQNGQAINLTGNLTFTDAENITPLDVMVMSPDYILLTIYQRNFDADPDNDYYNLLVHLDTGSVVSAPVGLNQQGNSGRSSLTQLGRDYFPPDARWNDTEDLYVVSVDYDELDLMNSADFIPPEDHDEVIDHHAGVPCPDPVEEVAEEAIEETAEDDTSSEEDSADTGDDAATDDSADATDTETTDETETSTTNTATCIEPTTEENTETAEEETTAQGNAMPIFIPTSRSFHIDEEPVPTAIYRMRLGGTSSYGLEKISATDDRPGLGQFIASKAGIIIYRNDDGGDNSYRVLLEHCEDNTGRLSTVLIAPHSSLILADDEAGNSSIFEVTQRGMNKLIFSCNGNVIREAYSGYSTLITSLKLPYNSPSIASYDYVYPYFINTNCQGGRLFPQQVPETLVQNPMPHVPGLSSTDPRGLRKSQLFNGKLYCIGYDAALELAIAELDPSTNSTASVLAQYEFLNFDFGLWLPSFDTIHVLDSSHLIFTGKSRTSSLVNTIMLDTDGNETNLNDTLAGFKVGQQIEITPPTN